MTPTAIAQAITTIAEAEQRFHLQRTQNPDFFHEWHTDRATLPDTDRATLQTLHDRYLYQRTNSQLLEQTVTLLLVSPLLAIAGFYDPPFTIRAEESITIELNDSEETLQGRIDVLILCQHPWVIIVESKKTALSVWTALPQAIAYLMANPNPNQAPRFGVITNGDDIVFVKIDGDRYGLSRVFSPFVASQELADVLHVLRNLSSQYQD